MKTNLIGVLMATVLVSTVTFAGGTYIINERAKNAGIMEANEAKKAEIAEQRAQATKATIAELHDKLNALVGFGNGEVYVDRDAKEWDAFVLRTDLTREVFENLSEEVQLSNVKASKDLKTVGELIKIAKQRNDVRALTFAENI
jgi:hypothetical protein